MDPATQAALEAIRAGDREARNAGFFALLEATAAPVDWAYEVWDQLVADLGHPDNHRRAIAAQLLCNLAQSDPDKRMVAVFPALLATTKDERFVTARHCLQSLWKVGTTGDAQRQMVIDGLSRRFEESAHEKNGTLIRYDIAQGLRHLYDAVGDDTIAVVARQLIATEADPKYRRKYESVWRTRTK